MALFRTFISALLCACAARAFVQPRPLRASTGTALSAAGGVDRRSALGLALVVLAPGAASAASQYQKIEAPTAEWEAAEKRAEEFRKRQRELAATFNGYFDAFSAASSDETVIENLNKMTLFIENMGGLPQGITSRQVVSRCRAKKSDFLQSGKWGTPAEIAYGRHAQALAAPVGAEAAIPRAGEPGRPRGRRGGRTAPLRAAPRARL